MASAQLTPYSRAALSHLHSTSPLDGYSIERYLSTTKKHLYRLKRRNVQVHDEGFLDIVLLDGHIVGIQVLTTKGDVGRGVVIIKKDGSLCNVPKEKVITVQMSDVSKSSSLRDSIGRASSLRDSLGNSSGVRSSGTRTPERTNNAMPAVPDNLLNLSEADTQLLVQYSGAILIALLVLKSILNIFSSLSFFLAPLVYIYAVQTCPAVSSFDAKKELKRVMRGAHLPEQQQPQGFFERTMNRVAASIGTELATSLGYELSVVDYWGAGRVAWVRVPIAGVDFCWIGAFGKFTLCIIW